MFGSDEWEILHAPESLKIFPYYVRDGQHKASLAHIHGRFRAERVVAEVVFRPSLALNNSFIK